MKSQITGEQRARQDEQEFRRAVRNLAEQQKRLDSLQELDSLREEPNYAGSKDKTEASAEATKDRDAIRKILTPNSEDLAAYKNFLDQRNTGIFRLFPDLNCTSKGIVRVDGECANSVPDTWAYSFRQRRYSDSNLYDIRLKNGNLLSGTFLLQSVLVDLGNVGLENVSLSAKEIKFLDDFKPETELSKIKTQYLQIAKGIKVDNYNYTKTVKASENTTYAARLIAYRCQINHAGEFFKKYPADAGKYMGLDDDKREDVIIAFRIIRKEADGSITILWKRLKRQDSAKIILV